MAIETVEQLAAAVTALIDGWCARRALAPLRYVLPVWPPESSLPSDWWQLRDAMTFVRRTLPHELAAEEQTAMNDVTDFLDRMLNLR
jgi:hypothetical protein